MALNGEILPPDAELSPEHEELLGHADRVARLFDYQFRVAGIPFGLDAIVGLIPGAGDLISGAVGVYFLELGRRMELPKHKMAMMVGNLAVDTAIGIVPVIGDLFDLGFKAHARNARILRRHAEKAAADRPRQGQGRRRA